ncbi:MAG: SDR family oxidoreductase [Pseudomonadota bacterium]
MTARLAGKTALITGASRGIGRAIAEAFAAEGADLVINARDAHALQSCAGQLRSTHGSTVTAIAADVTARDAVAQLVEQAWQAGPVDVLVNNAGAYRAAPFIEYAPQDFRDLFEVNVFGVIHLTQLMLPKMIARGGGNIVNVASTAGKWGSRNQSAYNMSKHAVVGMTRCVALEMAPHGIRVNAVCPWLVDTDLADGAVSEHAAIVNADESALKSAMVGSVPLHDRFIRTDEVAGLAVYLASDEASYVTGQSWTIDGGYTMV